MQMSRKVYKKPPPTIQEMLAILTSLLVCAVDGPGFFAAAVSTAKTCRCVVRSARRATGTGHASTTFVSIAATLGTPGIACTVPSSDDGPSRRPRNQGRRCCPRLSLDIRPPRTERLGIRPLIDRFIKDHESSVAAQVHARKGV